MVQAKTNLFKQEYIDQAEIFKALSHPARLQILDFLAATESCITGDISDDLPLGRTTVNQHLKELRDAGLIQGHIEGVKTKYCLSEKGIEQLRQILSILQNKLKSNIPTCK